MVYRVYIKRLIDIFLALLIILLACPILMFTWGILLLQNQGKAFFYQERPGKNQVPFYIIKFKTMNDRKDKEGKLLPDNERLTLFGKYVRKFSIDELPQLFNVLKGDMSLIGPRPLLLKYIPLYNAEQNRRHEVRPGITGWAQVNGRNQISWTRKFELDVEYVDNLSFALDFKIFWLTILKIIQREGVNQSSERTMEPFKGFN
ncbi:MAG: sugar transferase [Algoriphagus sp.]|jgi:undecaprenyl phosphate N,N'-diacetylbacillosamine 1-phosphate transferase|uniref:sugar transferase n=1 Tax=Algoriphagus sp. TaxID=1872435 RepID=UPI00261DCADF|nr:sugar transferase [Algoriphagus sp.]MDG1279225.1 sugar transferase [Algoriphagus sp.]